MSDVITISRDKAGAIVVEAGAKTHTCMASTSLVMEVLELHVRRLVEKTLQELLERSTRA